MRKMKYGAETPYGMVNREDFGPLHEPIPGTAEEQKAAADGD